MPIPMPIPMAYPHAYPHAAARRVRHVPHEHARDVIRVFGRRRGGERVGADVGLIASDVNLGRVRVERQHLVKAQAGAQAMG